MSGSTVNVSAISTSHFEAIRKRANVARFYSDAGPRESWDAPMDNFVKVSGSKSLQRREQKTAMSKLENLTIVQSLIAEKDSKEFLSQVSSKKL